MIFRQRIYLIALVLVLFLTAACSPSSPPGAPTPSTLEVFVFPGLTERHLISVEEIPLNNCNGRAELTASIERSHRVSRTIELSPGMTVDDSGQAGIPGVGQVGIGVAVATNSQVNYGSQDTVTHSVTVGAREGTNMLHTIHQYEIWEAGEVLVVAEGVDHRFPYRFRKDFSIETLPPANLGCPQDVPPAPTETLALPALPPTFIPPTAIVPTIPPTATSAPEVVPTATPTFSQRVIDNIATNPVGRISALLVFVVGIITAITQIVRLQREHPKTPKK